MKWVAFPLHPEVPEEGMTLEQLFAGRNLDVGAVLARLKAKADELGLPFNRPPFTCNSRRAQELGKWAESQGLGEGFHRVMFEAYFVHGQNIGLMPVLRQAVESLGLDADQAQLVLDRGDYAGAVDKDWEYSRHMGVRAVPSFLAGGRMLVGAQPQAEMARLIEAAGIGPREA